jgi:putative ABC transport system permease protein
MPDPFDWTGHLRARLAPLRLRPAREAEIIEELSQHLDQRYEELRARGTAESDARRMALDELLEPDALAKRMRSLRQAHVPPPVTLGAPKASLAGDLWQDLRYATRMLRRNPGFAATAILTLALGIGANSAIFALVDATLLRPLPFHDPGQLVMMWERSDTSPQGPVSPLNMLDWNDRSRAFVRVGGFTGGVGGMVMAGTDGTAETVSRQWVTDGIFEALGITPIAGRTFLPSDNDSRANVVVLSEALWRTRFANDPGIIGRDVRLDGDLFTVVGVVPNEAQLIGKASMWALRWIPREAPQARTAYGLRVVGRMKPGVTLESANADITSVAEGLAREFPKTNTGRGVTLVPMRDALIGSDLRLTSMLFLGVVGVVLLICCANVANLLLARATVRMRELGIRSALGAARGRVIRQLVTESLVLSIIGGIVGTGIGALILNAAPSLIPEGLLPGAVALTFDIRVIAFCAAATLIVGLLFGLAPAWQATASTSNQVMASDSRTTTGRGRVVRSLLVAAEVSTAVLLLFGAGLLLRTLIAVESVDRGFRTDRVLTMMVDPLGARYPTPASLLQFFETIAHEITALPGVRNVAWSSTLPLQPTEPFFFEIAGDPPLADSQRPTSDYQIVSPEYFEAVDLPIVDGRGFTDRDTLSGVPVCMVNEAFVRNHAQGRSPIGMRLMFRQTGSTAPPVVREIVGVARQVKGRPDALQDPVQIYVPMAQRPIDDMYLVVRPTSDDANALTPSVRAAIGRVDKEQLVSVREVMTLEDIAREATARHRFRAVLVTTFAGLALLLAMVGVFGILAYSVQQRVRDFGVRRALGATTNDVLRLVVGSAARVIMIGAVIGLVLAAVLSRLLTTMLFGVQPLDPMTFASVIVVVILTAAIAAAAPAWRAARIDPVIALRAE